MLDHPAHHRPMRSPAQIAAVDAVQALSCTVDAFVALEELFEVHPGCATCQLIDREKVGTLLGVLVTRLYLDVQAAESSVLAALPQPG